MSKIAISSILALITVTGAVRAEEESKLETIKRSLAEQCQKSTEKSSSACIAHALIISEIKKLSSAHKSTPPARAADESEPLKEGPPPLAKPHRFAIRADAPDDLFYPFAGSNGLSAGAAKGASVSYTNNFFSQNATTGAVTHTQNMTLAGRASFLLLDSPQLISSNLEWAPALFADVNGTWDNPSKKFGDSSAFKSGFDAQFHYRGSSSDFIPEHYFSVAGFGQTDFFGIGRVDGAEVAWSPANYKWGLAGVPIDQNPLLNNSLYQAFWIARGEARLVDVEIPGATLLQKRTYEWTGGTLRAYVFPFPSELPIGLSPVLGPEWTFIQDRLTLIGTAQFYQDISSRAAVHNYTAEIQFDLAGCSPKDPPSTCTRGSSSLSLEYDVGTDRDTLAYGKKLLGKFNYKY